VSAFEYALGGSSAVSLLGSAHRTAEGLHGVDRVTVWISLCAAITPLLAGLVHRTLLPEVVLLLVAGVLTGPNVLGLASSDEAIELLHELGPGMLFLLAGYEVELNELTGRGGRRAMVTWLICVGRAG
jgi:Kef-type K+ transport system membrane component KefB